MAPHEPQQQEEPPQRPLEVEDIGELLMARLLAGGRKRGLDADWGSSPSSPAAGTPCKGGSSPRRRSAGGRLQQAAAAAAATTTKTPPRAAAPHDEADDDGEGSDDEEEEDAVVESFWESPVVVSVVQELLAWPLGLAYSAVVLVVCTWAHLTNLAVYRLNKFVRRLGRLWRCLRPYLARSSSSDSDRSSIPCPLKLPDRLARNASMQVVKSGLYWCGPNNTMVKDASVGGGSPGAATDFFVPGRPSVIYVHGYQPRTIIRRFRESLNWADNDDVYGVDVNAADHWLKSGWQVGVFYWNQYADEPFIHDAEAKIWTHQTSVGMRYRKLSQCGTHVQTRYVFLAHIPCVAQQLADALQHRFPAGAASAPYRLVGHSLGSQVVIHAASLMAAAKRAEVEAGGGASFVLPTRITLLDPFFTMTPKAYLGWRTLPAVLTETMEGLREEERIVFETYKTSVLSHVAANTLRAHSVYFEVQLPHIPWWKLRSRHVAAPYIYFMSFAVPEIGQYLCGDDFGAHVAQLSELSHDAQEARDAFVRMARASDEHLRLLMEASVVDDLWQLFTSFFPVAAS